MTSFCHTEAVAYRILHVTVAVCDVHVGPILEIYCINLYIELQYFAAPLRPAPVQHTVVTREAMVPDTRKVPDIHTTHGTARQEPIHLSPDSSDQSDRSE